MPHPPFGELDSKLKEMLIMENINEIKLELMKAEVEVDRLRYVDYMKTEMFICNDLTKLKCLMYTVCLDYNKGIIDKSNLMNLSDSYKVLKHSLESMEEIKSMMARIDDIE
jgi:predicted ATPase